MTGAGEYSIFFRGRAERFAYAEKQTLAYDPCYIASIHVMSTETRSSLYEYSLHAVGDENNQNTLAFCCDVLSSGKRTVSYRRGELM